jgi:hypothetical protein
LILLTLALVGAAAAVIARRAVEPDPPFSPSDELDRIAADRDIEVRMLRILAKRHIARETADGARSLVQAAALYRVLNSHPPAPVPATCPTLAERPEEERLCRQVIGYVSGYEGELPDAAAAATRLELELQEELRRRGAIQLPDPAGLPSAEKLLEEARATMTQVERRACFPSTVLTTTRVTSEARHRPNVSSVRRPLP